MSGGLSVADAKMLLRATSVILSLTPFADVYTLSIKAVNAAE